MEVLSPGWNFNSLNGDEISSRKVSEDNVKVELQLYAKISSQVKRGEIFARFEQTELKFRSHVDEVKIIKQSINKASPDLNW